MRWQSFDLPDDGEAFNTFMSMEGVNVRYHKFVPHNLPDGSTFERVHCLYSYREDDVADETDAMGVLIDKARLVEHDDVYASLKNNRQRAIYLLTVYGISASEAETVMELLKPELSGLRARCIATAKGVRA